MRTPILDMLKSYKKKNRISFCMPGHKNGRGLISDFSSFTLDVTELFDTDNLQNPKNAIKEALENAKDFYKTKDTFFLTNGSTSGIFAMILSALKPHDKILVSRNCHSSVINALTLYDIQPIFINQPILPDFQISGGICCDLVSDLIKKHNPKAVLVTSPNYFGICCDIEKLSDICHKSNIPLLVDSAHGAHFWASDEDFPKPAIKMGADLVVESAHKTLNSANQTALLHYNSDIISHDRIKTVVSMLTTSSPSYLLCSSLDYAISDLKENGKKNWEKLLNRITLLKNNLSDDYKFIDSKQINKNFVYDIDNTRLTINFSDYDVTGFEISDILRTKYNIDIEMADLYNIILIPTSANADSDFDVLENALMDIKNTLTKKSSTLTTPQLPDIEQAISPFDAFQSNTKLINLTDSLNKISAKTIVSYPPAVAIIPIGGLITDEVLSTILSLKSNNAEITGLFDDKILIVE